MKSSTSPKTTEGSEPHPPVWPGTAEADQEDKESGQDNTIQPRRLWWLFWKKVPRPYIIAKIILQNGRIITKPVWVKSRPEFRYAKGRYCIKRECIYTERIKNKLRPVSYYFFEYPDPIHFRYRQTYDQETARTFKSLLDAKVVEDLSKAGDSIVMLVVLVCVIITTMCVMFLLAREMGWIGGK